MNIIDEHTFKKLKHEPRLRKATSKLYAYGSGQPIPVLGQFSTRVLYIGQYRSIEFVVTNGNHGNLLSYESAVQLGILKRIANTATPRSLDS